MEKLTDEELEAVACRFPTHLGKPLLSVQIQRMLAELRAARAQLTSEEREALEFARGCVHVQHEQSVREAAADGCEPSPHWRDVTFALLDRLLGGSEIK